MSKSARRLGKGLDSLVSNLSHVPPRTSVQVPAEQEHGTSRHLVGPPATARVEMLSIASIASNPYQPRTGDIGESAHDLEESIRRTGILQPVLVRETERGFQLIAGERRTAAARAIGLVQVPAIIRQATDEEMLELALVENIQREDLNPIDRAMAYRQYCERFGLTTEEVARRLGEDRSTVANYLRLLELSLDLRDRVARGQMTMGHARCLLGISQESRRLELAESIERNGLSVRAVEQIVRSEKSLAARDRPTGNEVADCRSPHLRVVEESFERTLKTKVAIQEGKRKGRGRIVIEYFNLDDFDRICVALGVELE